MIPPHRHRSRAGNADPRFLFRVGRRIVRSLVDARIRDAVEGDLEELYEARLRAAGRGRAAVRYLLDLISLLPAGAALRHAARTGPASGRPMEGWMDLLRDMRHAARVLLANPAYSGVVVLTLALAIGANTAIFGVVDGVLLKPLPFDDPDEIVTLREHSIGPREKDAPPSISQRLYLAWRDGGRAFDDIAMYSSESKTLTGLAEPARISGAAVSPSLFPLLGANAELGRTLAAGEDRTAVDTVVVLSHRTWQRYFAGDPAIVGRSVRMDDSSRTVVGVMPSGFAFPDAESDYWVPLSIAPPGGPTEDTAAGAAREGRQPGVEVRRRVAATQGDDEGEGGAEGPQRPPRQEAHMEFFGRAVARLADGVSPALAAEEGTRLVRGLRADDPEMGDEEVSVEVLPMQEQLVGGVRRPLLMLMGAVGFVLLIACANVANLVMARASGRRRETAVRAAMGAGWWGLGRPLLAESGLLALAGAVAGLLLALFGLRTLAATGPDFIPRLGEVGIDARAVLFTAAVTVLTALLFSIAPLRSAARLDLTGTLKEEGGTGSGGTGHNVGRRLLVVGEVAASVVLLTGAALLIGSFLRLSSVDHGFDPDNLLAIELQLPTTAYPDSTAQLDAYDRIIGRLETLPSVASATVSSRPPAVPANIRIAMRVPDSDLPPDVRPTAVGLRFVENDYFRAVGARLVAGRFFNREDRPETSPVMILSESGVRALYGPDQDPLERHVDFMGSGLEVVGVVGDVRTAGADPEPQPEIYLPYRQAPPPMIPMLFRVANVLVHTESAPLEALPAIRSVITQEVPDGVVLSASTVRDRLADAVAEPRFYASLVGAFAVLALVLAAVGIYGLLAYTVQQGVRETAIRRALGAPAGDILRGVLGGGLALAVVGLVVGVGGALALSRLLEAMLYEVQPGDPATLALVVVTFLGVAVLAILVPARRAVRVDPMEALK